MFTFIWLDDIPHSYDVENKLNEMWWDQINWSYDDDDLSLFSFCLSLSLFLGRCCLHYLYSLFNLFLLLFLLFLYKFIFSVYIYRHVICNQCFEYYMKSNDLSMLNKQKWLIFLWIIMFVCKIFTKGCQDEWMTVTRLCNECFWFSYHTFEKYSNWSKCQCLGSFRIGWNLMNV